MVPFLKQFRVPKLLQIRVHFLIDFGASFWLQNVAQIGCKAPQKVSKRQRSAPKRAPSGCASAVLVLFKKATKTLYFTMVLVSPSCPKRPKDSHKALMGPSCTPRDDQEDSTKATQTASSETGPKKTPKRRQKGCQKRVRKVSESRSEKVSENACENLRNSAAPDPSTGSPQSPDTM